MGGTNGESGSPCQESLDKQKLNCLKDIMDIVLQLSDEEWKALTKDMPKMHTRLDFAALCTKIVTSVSASVVKSYLPSLIDIFGMESVLQADAKLQNFKAGSGCLSSTSTSSGHSSERTTADRSPTNVADVIGDIVKNTLSELKNAMKTAILKVTSMKVKKVACSLENEKKNLLSGKSKQPILTKKTERGRKICDLSETKEIEPDTAAITGTIVMVVLDVIEGSSVEQTVLQQARGLLTAAAERIKLLALRSNLDESIIQSTSEQNAPVTHEELQTRAVRSVSKVLLSNASASKLSGSTDKATASMPCHLYATSTEIVGTVIQSIQDTLSASGQSSHPDEQQKSDDFLTSGISADSGMFSATNRMFHTIHEKVKEFFNVSKNPVKHSAEKENNKADRISQLDDLTMNCTNEICGEIISLYNSDVSESKCHTADGGSLSEVFLSSQRELHSIMKGLEELVTMSRSSSKSSLKYLSGQRSKDLLIPGSISVDKEFAPNYPLSTQYAGKIFSDRFQEKAIQTIADVLLKTEGKLFASVSAQYSAAPSPATSEPDMPLNNTILCSLSGSSAELPSSLGTAELFTETIPCHSHSTNTEIVENVIQHLDMLSALEEVEMSESASTSSAAHISTASGIMGVFLKQLRRLSLSVRSDDSGSLSEPAPPHESFLLAARKIHRKIHKMVFGFVSEHEQLALADSKVFINRHSSKPYKHSVQSLLSKTSPHAPPKKIECSSEMVQDSYSPGFISRFPSDHSTSKKQNIQDFEPIISQSTKIQQTLNSDEFLSKATEVVSDILIKNLILCCTSIQTDSDSSSASSCMPTASAHSLCSAAHKITETIISGMDRVDADAFSVLSDSKSLTGSTRTSTPVNIFENMRRNLQALFERSFRNTDDTCLHPYDTNSMSGSRSSPLCLEDAQLAGDEAVSIWSVGESHTLDVVVDNYSNEVIGTVIDLFLHADHRRKSSSSELSTTTQVVSDILIRMASSEILTKSNNALDLTTGPTCFTTRAVSEDILYAAADVSRIVINVLDDFYESMRSIVAEANSNSDAFMGVLDAFSVSGSNILDRKSTPLDIFSKVRGHLHDFYRTFNQEKRHSVFDSESLDSLSHLLDNLLMPGCSNTDSSPVSKMESSSLTAQISSLQMMGDEKIVITQSCKKIASTSHSTNKVLSDWQMNQMNLELCTDELIAEIVDLSKSALTDQCTLKDFHILSSDHFQAKSTHRLGNILFKMVESCPLSSDHQIATDSEVHHRKEFSECLGSAASEISRSAGTTLKGFLATVFLATHSLSQNGPGFYVKCSTSRASMTPLLSDYVNLFTPLQLFIEVRNKLKGIFTPLMIKADESNWISAVQERDADFTAVQERDAQVSDESALTQHLAKTPDSATISEDTICEHAHGITDLTAEIRRKDKMRSGVVDRSLSDSNLKMSGTWICASSMGFPSTIVHLFAEESIKYLLQYLLNPSIKHSHVVRPSQAAQGSRDSDEVLSLDRLTSEVSGQIEDPVASHVGDCGVTSSPPSVSPTSSNRAGSAEVNLGNLTISSEENLPSSNSLFLQSDSYLLDATHASVKKSSRFQFSLKKKSPMIKFDWKFLKKSNLDSLTSVASRQLKDPVVFHVTPEHSGTQADCGATSSPPTVSPTSSNSAGSAEVNLGNLTLSSEENLLRSNSPCLLNDSCLLDPAHDVVEKKSSRLCSFLKKKSPMIKFGWKKANKICPENLTASDLQADNPEFSSCVESVNDRSSVEKPLNLLSRIFSAISEAFPKLLKAEPE